MQKWYKQIVRRIKRFNWRLFVFLNRIQLPGFGGVGLFDVLRFFYQGLQDKHFSLSAMAMSYRFFFALFPGLILIFMLIPYIPVDNLQEQVNQFLQTVVPASSMDFISGVVHEFFQKPGFSIFGFNLVLLLYSAMAGIKVMMDAFARKDRIFAKRNFIEYNSVALMILLILMVIFVFMITVILSGEYLIDWLVMKNFIKEGWVTLSLNVFEWLILFLALQVGFSTLYVLGPPVKERWSFISPGSIFAGALSLLAIVVFRFVITEFGSYNKIYGSISAIMILMLWFYWLSIVLLLGFELNRAIAVARLNPRARLRAERINAEKKEKNTVSTIKKINMHPTFKKMNYKGQEPILVHKAPEEFEEVLTAMREVTEVHTLPEDGQQYEYWLFFAKNAEDLSEIPPLVQGRYEGDVYLWIAYPKKSSKKYKSDINRDSEEWKIIGQLGVEPVRQVAIDNDWSALRFRHVDFIKSLNRRSSMIISQKGKDRQAE